MFRLYEAAGPRLSKKGAQSEGWPMSWERGVTFLEASFNTGCADAGLT